MLVGVTGLARGREFDPTTLTEIGAIKHQGSGSGRGGVVVVIIMIRIIVIISVILIIMRIIVMCIS